MAVGQFVPENILAVKGVRLASACASIKDWERDDLCLLEICEGASVAGVFTKNAFCAEPVKICRQNLAQTSPRYLLINAGNANACTGEAGHQAALRCCEAQSELAGVAANAVLPFSTGVIGEVLDAEKIVSVLPDLNQHLSAESDAWNRAAKAIMTTDTRPKLISKSLELGGKSITITGMAKGAGMIKPNMGTMLAYVACDARVDATSLQSLIQVAANRSFNRITIDGDTSTNDALMLIASGKAQNSEIKQGSADYAALSLAVTQICQALAKEMVKDAEGATKCVRVIVKGGETEQECLDVAYAICHSPLIKTAWFASDPNWGRIVAAIGYAGIPDLDSSLVKVHLDDVLIVENGGRASTYTEEAGQAVFNKDEFDIVVDLARGSAKEELWSSDLSHEYVRINAEYRT
jgi:glutamate N-acetyltransferase/amino-acid N-acetyltransferase